MYRKLLDNLQSKSGTVWNVLAVVIRRNFYFEDDQSGLSEVARGCSPVLIGDTKITTGVSVSTNGCLFVSLATDWGLVQSMSCLSLYDSWDRL